MTNQHSQKQKDLEEYRKRRWREEIKVYSVRLPKQQVLDIDTLVMQGKYMSRSEFIRLAVRELLKDEVIK